MCGHGPAEKKDAVTLTSHDNVSWRKVAETLREIVIVYCDDGGGDAPVPQHQVSVVYCGRHCVNGNGSQGIRSVTPAEAVILTYDLDPDPMVHMSARLDSLKLPGLCLQCRPFWTVAAITGTVYNLYTFRNIN